MRTSVGVFWKVRSSNYGSNLPKVLSGSGLHKLTIIQLEAAHEVICNFIEFPDFKSVIQLAKNDVTFDTLRLPYAIGQRLRRGLKQKRRGLQLIALQLIRFQLSRLTPYMIRRKDFFDCFRLADPKQKSS